MPSLVRFIVVVALVAAAVYGGMVALVNVVQVSPRPMEETIPAARLNK